MCTLPSGGLAAHDRIAYRKASYLLGAGVSLSSHTQKGSLVPDGKQKRRGHLLLIGGAERRSSDSEILQHFVKEAGGKKAKILVCAAV